MKDKHIELINASLELFDIKLEKEVEELITPLIADYVHKGESITVGHAQGIEDVITCGYFKEDTEDALRIIEDILKGEYSQWQ